MSDTWHSTDRRSIDSLRRNHLRLAADGKYEVLVPVTDETFRLVKVDRLETAAHMLEQIEDPIDIAAAIESHAPERKELLRTLEPVVQSVPGAVLSGRMKEFESLKAKIFDKVRKRGESFRLSEVDDIVGARIAAPTRAQVGLIAERIRSLEGVHVVKIDPISYERGYRAVHVTIQINGGPNLEVQVMTARNLAWTLWNAKRIYKPNISKSTPYFKKLEAYDRALINYLNALDDGIEPPPRPNYRLFGVDADDAFDEEALK